MPGPTIADLIRRESRAGLRDRELSLLETTLRKDGPAVAYVHGPSSIGKTALLRAFEATLDERGGARLRIEAGAVEPRPEAILPALASGFGIEPGDLPEIASALAARPGRLVLTVDDVDTWRLAASWLRLELACRRPCASFSPALRRRRGSGRITDGCSWTCDSGRSPARMWTRWPPATASTPAPPSAYGRSPPVNRSAYASPSTRRMPEHWRRPAMPARWRTRSCTRWATPSCAARPRPAPSAAVPAALVTAILGAAEPVGEDLLERVEALPFADRDAEGLFIAEPVRRAIVERLSGLEAERHALWRRRAADWLTSRLRTASPRDRWRHMADLLHLLDQPALRKASSRPTDPRCRWSRRGRATTLQSSA